MMCREYYILIDREMGKMPEASEIVLVGTPNSQTVLIERRHCLIQL